MQSEETENKKRVLFPTFLVIYKMAKSVETSCITLMVMGVNLPISLSKKEMILPAETTK